MAAKGILFDAEARKAIESGMRKVFDSIRITLGPKGRNVVIEKKFGSPLITNDGVTVAKEIELADPFENLGAQLIKEVASKTNDVAGDGTTTATILAYHMVKEGIKAVTSGANPMFLKRGIDKAIEVAVNHLKKMAKEIDINSDDVKRVAAIAANNDEKIGEIIANTIKKVGKNGVITIEEAKSAETKSEVVEGMQFDRGYISPYFITDPEKMEAVLEEPYILITEKKISAVHDILPILETIVKLGKPLLIIAEDVEGEALATLVVNKLRGVLQVCAVKAPGFGERRKEMLKDIAILTGGIVISDEVGIKLENVKPEHLGRAEKVRVDKEHTTIIGGKGNPEEIKARIEQIKQLLEKTDSEYEKEKLQERLAKLSGGVGVIKVGAYTETELKEKKMRMEDALNATKAALEEGILPGGGTAYIRVIPELEKLYKELEGDEAVGVKIVMTALDKPLRQIAENAGYDSGLIVEKVKTASKDTHGFNAVTGEIVDMFDAGIIDPLKVTRSALQHAASVASMVITTETLIAELPEKEKEKTPAGVGSEF